jgi:hypothetical protein
MPKPHESTPLQAAGTVQELDAPMIAELRAAVQRVALCPDEVQRIAAAALSVHATQDAIRRRLSAQEITEVQNAPVTLRAPD